VLLASFYRLGLFPFNEDKKAGLLQFYFGGEIAFNVFKFPENSK